MNISTIGQYTIAEPLILWCSGFKRNMALDTSPKWTQMDAIWNVIWFNYVDG